MLISTKQDNNLYLNTTITATHTETNETYMIYDNIQTALLEKLSEYVKHYHQYLTLKEPNQELEEELKRFKTDAVYSLWKNGKQYYVHYLAVDRETNELMVVYQAMYKPYKHYVRPYKMFTSLVEPGREDENITKQKYRFELVK